MRTLQKLTIGLSAVFILSGFLSSEQPDPDIEVKEKLYSFGYSVNWDDKVIYVSNLIYCYLDNTATSLNYNKASLLVKWSKKAEARGCEYCEDEVIWWGSYNEVDERRDEIIADYKKDDFSVKYVGDFAFECE